MDVKIFRVYLKLTIVPKGELTIVLENEDDIKDNIVSIYICASGTV